MADIPPEALDDPFHPPSIPTQVECLHCGEVYDSYLIQWRANSDASDRENMPGYWCCPTPDCDGIGFGFDIWPTDPDYVSEDGSMMSFDDEDGEEDDDDAYAEESLDPEIQAAVDHDLNILEQAIRDDLLPHSDDPEIEAAVQHDLEIIKSSLEDGDDEEGDEDEIDFALDDVAEDDDPEHVRGTRRSEWMDDDDIPF